MRLLRTLAAIAVLSGTGDHAPVRSSGLVVFEGDGFTFSYPSTATVRLHAHGVEIVGPKAAAADDPWYGHTMRYLPDPAYRLSVDVVAADSALGFVITIAGQAARTRCAQCDSESVYLANGDQAVRFRYAFGHDENYFPALQRMLYDQILSSFRWRNGPAAPMPSQGLETYHGDGFTFAYPLGTEIASGDGKMVFSGPPIPNRDVPLQSDTAAVDRTDAGFGLALTVARNPGGLSLQQWVESLVAADHRRGDSADAADPDADTAETHAWELQGPDTITVAGLAALQVFVPCGDCDEHRVYLARGTQIVMLEYSFGDVTSLPPMQRLIIANMLASFTWTDR